MPTNVEGEDLNNEPFEIGKFHNSVPINWLPKTYKTPRGDEMPRPYCSSGSDRSHLKFTLLWPPPPRHTAAEPTSDCESMLMKVISFKYPTVSLLLGICLCAMPCRSSGQDTSVVCNAGIGQFSIKVPHRSPRLSVGPQRDRGFASRACEASLVHGRDEVPGCKPRRAG